MWKLRWRSRQNRRSRIPRTSHARQESKKRTPASTKGRPDDDLNVTTAAYRCTVLENSTTDILRRGDTQEDVYESITECAEYSVLETQTREETYSNYVTDSEIEAPSSHTSFVHTGPATPANGEERRPLSQMLQGVTNESYLELLPPSAAVREHNTRNE